MLKSMKKEDSAPNLAHPPSSRGCEANKFNHACTVTTVMCPHLVGVCVHERGAVHDNEFHLSTKKVIIIKFYLQKHF